jgi:hypothetical protein
MLIQNLISKIDEHYQRLVVAENKNKANEAIFSSINEYHVLFNKARTNHENLQYKLERIKPNVQKVDDIVAGYIVLMDDFKSKEIDLSTYKEKMSSLSFTLRSGYCAIQKDTWGNKWVKTICIRKLKYRLQQF